MNLLKELHLHNKFLTFKKKMVVVYKTKFAVLENNKKYFLKLLYKVFYLFSLFLKYLE